MSDTEARQTTEYVTRLELVEKLSESQANSIKLFGWLITALFTLSSILLTVISYQAGRMSTDAVRDAVSHSEIVIGSIEKMAAKAVEQNASAMELVRGKNDVMYDRLDSKLNEFQQKTQGILVKPELVLFSEGAPMTQTEIEVENLTHVNIAHLSIANVSGGVADYATLKVYVDKGELFHYGHETTKDVYDIPKGFSSGFEYYITRRIGAHDYVSLPPMTLNCTEDIQSVTLRLELYYGAEKPKIYSLKLIKVSKRR